MIVQVTAVVLPALFVASGLFGLGVLGMTWRTYGGAFRRLQRELVACDDMQSATVTLVRHDVRVMGHPGAAPAGPASAGARRGQPRSASRPARCRLTRA
jgi:hypothetical protein